MQPSRHRCLGTSISSTLQRYTRLPLTGAQHAVYTACSASHPLEHDDSIAGLACDALLYFAHCDAGAVLWVLAVHGPTIHQGRVMAVHLPWQAMWSEFTGQTGLMRTPTLYAAMLSPQLLHRPGHDDASSITGSSAVPLYIRYVLTSCRTPSKCTPLRMASSRSPISAVIGLSSLSRTCVHP